MNRRVFIPLLLLAAVLPIFPGCSGCSPAPQVWPDKPGKRILTTFAPLYCFAQKIAGDDANVMCLLSSSDPHGADWTPQDVLKVRGANLFIANGLGIDDALIRGLVSNASKKVLLLDIGEEFKKQHQKLLRIGKHDDHDHDHGHDHKKDDKDNHAGEDNQRPDPHIWLGPKRAKEMVELIVRKMIDIETDHAKARRYRERAEDFKNELDRLTKYGQKMFKDKKNRRIVTQHGSMGYFADEFGLEIVGSVRSSDNNNAAADKLVQDCLKEPPAAFTYEASFKKDEVETIRETLRKKGVITKLAEVDPIEMFPPGPPNADYYLERMKMNIDNLAQALKE